MQMISLFFVALSAIFVVVDPLAAAPIFASMTEGYDSKEVQSIVRRSTFTGAALLIAFTLFGGLLFKLLRVELGAFRIAGGILLLLTAIDMLRAKLSSCRCSRKELSAATKARADIAIVPIATPLLAGPGSMATVMVLMSDAKSMFAAVPIIAAILVTFAVAWALLHASHALRKRLNPAVMAVMQRVMGLVLLAVSIQFMFAGGKQLLGL